MSPDPRSLAERISAETGLEFSGREGRDSDGARWLELQPTGYPPGQTFTLRTLIGWRRLDVHFRPGNFAGDFNWHVHNLIIGASRNWCKTVIEWNLAADPKHAVIGQDLQQGDTWSHLVPLVEVAAVEGHDPIARRRRIDMRAIAQRRHLGTQCRRQIRQRGRRWWRAVGQRLDLARPRQPRSSLDRPRQPRPRLDRLTEPLRQAR